MKVEAAATTEGDRGEEKIILFLHVFVICFFYLFVYLEGRF